MKQDSDDEGGTSAAVPSEGASADPGTTKLPRRELILASARQLFAKRGFHSVGVNEIGAAAGVTGPAIYRHFPNKEGLLVALFERLTGRLLLGIAQIQSEARDPQDALERLVALHTEIALDDRELIALYLKEQQNLPDRERRRTRQRQREYIQYWADVLGDLRPDLSPAALRTAVHGAIWFINSIGFHHSNLHRDQIDRMFERMVLAALSA